MSRQLDIGHGREGNFPGDRMNMHRFRRIRPFDTSGLHDDACEYGTVMHDNRPNVLVTKHLAETGPS